MAKVPTAEEIAEAWITGTRLAPTIQKPSPAPVPVKKDLSFGVSREKFDELLKKHNLDPAEELILLVKKGNLDTDQQIKVLSELNAYRMPKLKAVEVKQDIDVSISVVIRRFGEEAPPKEKPIIINQEPVTN